MNSLRFNLLILVLFMAFVFLQYRLWFGASSVRDLFQLHTAMQKQTMENDQLKKRNDELLAQIQHLQSNEDAAESKARDELGMIKKGETFYQIIK